MSAARDHALNLINNDAHSDLILTALPLVANVFSIVVKVSPLAHVEEVHVVPLPSLMLVQQLSVWPDLPHKSGHAHPGGNHVPGAHGPAAFWCLEHFHPVLQALQAQAPQTLESLNLLSRSRHQVTGAHCLAAL